MVLDDFMFHVTRKWYRFYWALMVVINVAIMSGFLVNRFAPTILPGVATYGINSTAVAMSAIVLIYLIGPFWYVERRAPAIASLLGAMSNALVLLYILNVTDTGAATIPFVVLWLITTFLNGMYGFPLLLGSMLITNIFLLSGSDFNVMHFSIYSWVLAAGAAFAVPVGYWFWKNRFVNQQEQQVNQLSGMLRTNQQQSEILIRSIADGVIGVNTEGKITLMNPAASEMTGWQIDEAAGVDVQLVIKLATEAGETLPDEDNPFTQVLEDQKPASHNLQLSSRDDQKRIISLIVSPIITPGTNTVSGVVAVIRDISEERAAEKQRAEFISTASHEMRTPVAAIEGYLALALNEKVSTIDIRARGYLQKAHSSTQHLGKLFQDLLTSSKAEDGRLSNHPAVVEMGAFMQQLSDDLKFSAEKKGLFAEFVIGASDATVDATNKDASESHMVKPLYYVHVDPDRMREVITNLFDNACKYTEQGKITLGITGDAEVVQLYIRDTGSGIPSDDLPHLFQKFYRVDNSATRTIGGTGLGLFICRKIVEIYHGRIWVESQISKGSTFFINLPRLTTQRATELQIAEAATPAPANPAAAPPPGTAAGTT